MRSPISDRGRQRLRTLLIVGVTALVIAPAAALATHGFDDVDDGDFFHAAVDWMKDNGVTVGCNPSGGNTRYCPDDPVTRGQMAVFLERLDSKDVFLRPGEVDLDGGDADTVDGKHASAFLGVNAKAADADELDGKDSTAFAASDHDHRETVTRIDSCAGPSFGPDQDAQTTLQQQIGGGWLVIISSGVGDLFCDPDLPDGAVITGFTAHLWDTDDAEDFNIPGCWLRASSTASPGTTLDVAFAGPTSGGGGPQVITDDTVTHTVDTAEWFYFYHCGIPTWPDLGLIGVKTTYTISDVPTG